MHGQTVAYITMTLAAVICAACGLYVAFVETQNIMGCFP